MRRIAILAWVVCIIAITGRGIAQFGTTSTSTTSSGTGTMPGRIVGTSSITTSPVGNRQPSAAPQAGQSITQNAMQRPYDPNRPYDAFRGTNIDPKTVVAPVIGPDGKAIVAPDKLDVLSSKIRSMFGFMAPPPRPAYAPGITRRSQERIQSRTWRRD